MTERSRWSFGSIRNLQRRMILDLDLSERSPRASVRGFCPTNLTGELVVGLEQIDSHAPMRGGGAEAKCSVTEEHGGKSWTNSCRRPTDIVAESSCVSVRIRGVHLK